MNQEDTKTLQVELTPFELEEFDNTLGSKTREETIKSAINLWIHRYKQLTQSKSESETTKAPTKRGPMTFYSMGEFGRVKEF